jgi:hypothetical protein
MKTYVVIGSYGKWEDHTEEVLYAGNNKEKAESMMMDGSWDELELQVWLNEIKIQMYNKINGVWEIFYDKSSEIKNNLDKLKKDIEDNEKLLKQIEEA